MAEPHANHTIYDNTREVADVDELLGRVSADRFQEWYQERQWRKNIQEGQPYFNGPGTVPIPERHSPSQLLQCHRKLFYRQENSPKEKSDPHGIFWFGTRFEEDLLFPFLHSVVTDTATYVQNSIWIDFTIESDSGDLQIRGSTDPVIVDADAVPILPTEVKTKSSTDNIDEPNPHHKAQVHAYLVGLSEKFDSEFSDALLIYGGRERLDVKIFHVEFDADFWNDVVLDWAEDHTQFRIDRELPPANPRYDWECRFCSYRARCGKDDTPHSDTGPRGFLPEYTGYPYETVVEYLEGHQNESLTPSLADKFPSLAERYGVANWYCTTCSSNVAWEKTKSRDNPLCPHCADKGEMSLLSLQQGKE